MFSLGIHLKYLTEKVFLHGSIPANPPGAYTPTPAESLKVLLPQRRQAQSGRGTGQDDRTNGVPHLHTLGQDVSKGLFNTPGYQILGGPIMSNGAERDAARMFEPLTVIFTIDLGKSAGDLQVQLGLFFGSLLLQGLSSPIEG